MSLIELARKLRPYIELAAKSLGDEDALEAKELFPAWHLDGVYEAGDRVLYGGKLYRCLMGHTAQEMWTPAESPSLWAEVLPGQDGTEIGEWAQPDSTNPYAEGDRVIHNGTVWESTINGNVWEPGVYGWREVAE